MTSARVLSVKQVNTYLQKSHPPKLIVAAIGTVPSSGWKHASLEAWRYIVTPDDLIQDFDFIADPPSNISLSVILPINAETETAIDINNYWGEGKPLKGIRVHAREGAIEHAIETANNDHTELQDHTVTWLWKALTTPAFGTSELFVGKVLRVYHTGDVITKEFREDRANVELDTHERIAAVWFG